MTINMSITHEGLTANELAALLWDGINLADEKGDYDARCALQEIAGGYGFAYKKAEIRNLVRAALRECGRRSVECGPQHSDEYTEFAAEWCLEQAKQVWG